VGFLPVVEGARDAKRGYEGQLTTISKLQKLATLNTKRIWALLQCDLPQIPKQRHNRELGQTQMIVDDLISFIYLL
jgi:hypothetical protein